MKIEAIKKTPVESHDLTGISAGIRQGCFALFLTLFAFVVLRLIFPQTLLPATTWPEGLLLLLAVASLLISLLRQVPLQNVVRVAVTIAIIGAVFSEFAAWTGIPFGSFDYTSKIGPRLFDCLPWALPGIWMVLILSSRGVAQLALRRWRGGGNYGLWMMGATAALTAWLGFGFELFATAGMGYWRWQSSETVRTWYGAPWFGLLGWMAGALLILPFATPSLINKKPVDPPPPEYHPLIVWLLLNLLSASGCALNHLVPAAAIIFLGSVTVTILAARGVGVLKTGSPR